MPLDILLLTLLQKTPAPGLELHKRIQEENSHIWQADLPQVYRALNRLEEDGYLTSEEGPSKRGPKRRVYSLTEAGRSRISELLMDGPALPPDRVGYLAQVLALGVLNDLDIALDFFHRLKSRLTARLDHLQNSQSSQEKSGRNPSTEELFTALSRDSAIAATVAQLAWAARAIAQLKVEIERRRPNLP